MAIDSFWKDVVFALRILRRSPWFTAVAVVTLALGVGASTSLFSIVRGALLERWPYDGYDRIVTLRAETPQVGRRAYPLWSAAEYRDLADRSDLFDYVIAGEGRGVTWNSGTAPERVAAAVMTANAWPMLGISPLLGRTFGAADDRPGAARVVVLNYRFWRNRLGANTRVLGTTLRIDDASYTIVGVMPREFVWWDQDLYLPIQLDVRDPDRTDRRWYIQARLRAGVRREQAEAALASTAARWRQTAQLPEYEHLRISLLPLVAETLRDVRQVLYLLLAAVGLVLTVASANVATLLLIRGSRRRGEIAVRLALGAAPLRVVRQLLTENLIVALLAGAVGLWLGDALLQPLVSLIPDGIPAEAHIATDWRAASFALIVAVASGVLFGIVPALRSIAGNTAADIRSSSPRSAAGVSRVLDAFMVAQFAMALVVLSATAVTVLSFERTLQADPGFRSRGILTFRIAMSASSVAEDPTSFDRIIRRLRALPGVQAAAAGTSVPVGPGRTASFSADHDTSRFEANIDAVTPGFFETLETPVVEGRDFHDDDGRERARVAIVNQSAAARYWPGMAAVGRHLVRHDTGSASTDLLVVGVTRDMRRDGLSAAADPGVFVPVAQQPPSSLAVLVRAGRSDQGLFTAVRSAIAAAAPEVPVYAPRLLDDLRADSLGSERLAAVLLAAFGAVALVLSMVGIYGVTRYIVEQRKGELGVRIALGADRRTVLTIVLARSLRNVALGIAVGGLCSSFAVRALAATLVGLSASATTAFVAAAFPLIVASLAAAYLPARRAASLDPIEALRCS